MTHFYGSQNQNSGWGASAYHPTPSPSLARKPSKSWSLLSLSRSSLLRRQPAKMVVCRVVLLDQENFQVEIAKNALGKILFDNVKQKLNLEEADYFGLSFRNSHNLRFWLNLDKRIDKQVESTKDMVFYWEVKFYPPAPEQLNEDLTRYLIVLQIRQDLFNGRLPASFQTSAILGSYTAQGEIGDYDKHMHQDIEYLRPYSFAPKQSEELLGRIRELHKTCKGLTPAEADLYFLENAKKCAQYGVDLFNVKDSKNMEVRIGVSASGLYVYHGRLRMETFKWPRMLKISYKTNIFHIKVRPAEFEQHQKTVGFKLPSPKLAKRLWRIAVENHQFFRLNQPELTDTSSLKGFGTNRRWRMSGRTQAQLKNIGTPRKSFSRTNSIMSTDTYPYPSLHQSAGTMPIPAARGGSREPDVNRNFNTIGEGKRVLVPSVSDQGSTSFPKQGHPTKFTEKSADVSYDDSGEYIPDSLDSTSVSRDPQSTRRAPTSNHEDLDPDSDPHGQYNFVNGDVDDPHSSHDMLPSLNSAGRLPNGTQLRKPVPMQRSTDGLDRNPSTNGYENGAPDELPAHQVPVEEMMPMSASSAPLQSQANRTSPPSHSMRPHPRASSPSSVKPREPAPRPSTSSSSQSPSLSAKPRTPSSSSQQPYAPSPKTRTPPTNRQHPPAPRFGVGELPMPKFSLESAGVMPSGGVDDSVKLSMKERAEKVIKVGVPPTVKTTGMRFAGASTEPNTRSTWSPPTVKTEKRHFNYIPKSNTSTNGYGTPIERISETTTYTTERDGYIEKKVKHTITLSGDDTLDDQLLLDAIQAVTGLDQSLGVDRIEIKTEEDCT